ncbi:MAG TPA: DUF559 domain-containing protein [Ktedonobacterales bacterium]
MNDRQPVRGPRIPAVKRELARSFRRNPTPAEQLLWAHLRGGQLAGARFRRQHFIAGFIVDFYCHSARLVVEVDGGIHRGQAKEDALREQALLDFGLNIVRFSNDAVMGDMTGVLQRIAAALTPWPPLPQGEGEAETP